MKFEPNCIFCKIADHQIPSSILYEDEDVIAFLDVNPVSYGHTIVIPKEHYDNMLTCPKEVMNKVYNVAQRIGQVAIKSLGAKGVNVLANCYPAAGQTVMHFHVHVIPRYEAKDGFLLEFTKQENINLIELKDKIKDNLK